MGKKISQVKKILKKSGETKEQLLNSNDLIKLLRPKVYITDTSSFKSLVQELTGNGNGNGTVIASSGELSPPEYHDHHASLPPQVMEDVILVPDIENTETNLAGYSTYVDNSSFQMCQLNDHTINVPSLDLEPFSHLGSDLPSVGFENLDESWFLDQEENYYLTQEVSIYD